MNRAGACQYIKPVGAAKISCEFLAELTARYILLSGEVSKSALMP
jgi:hypothetical protein